MMWEKKKAFFRFGELQEFPSHEDVFLVFREFFCGFNIVENRGQEGARTWEQTPYVPVFRVVLEEYIAYLKLSEEEQAEKRSYFEVL